MKNLSMNLIHSIFFISSFFSPFFEIRLPFVSLFNKIFITKITTTTTTNKQLAETVGVV